MGTRKDDIYSSDMNMTTFNMLLPMGTLTVRFLTYPAQLVKTRMQAATPDGEVIYQNTRHAFRSILKNEGMTSFYKGFGTSLSILPLGVIFLNLMEYSKSWLVRNEILDSRSYFLPLVSSGLASFMVQIIGVPVDVIVQNSMMNRAEKKRSIELVYSKFQHEGIRGFYRGFTASVLTYTPHSIAVWTLYTNSRIYVKEKCKGLTPVLEKNMLVGSMNMQEGLITACCGLLSGSLVAIAMNPVDVVKTRQQVQGQRLSFRDTASLVLRTNGWRGFLRGTSAKMLVSGPYSMLGFSGYEIIKQLASKRES